MRSIYALGLFAFAGFSAAQDQPQDNYPYTINPDDVPIATRDAWCNDQKTQCPLICLQQPGVTTMNTVSNDCYTDTLTYSCVCDNGVSPNITQYSQTLPYWICTEWGNECVAACGSDNSCSNKCRADHPCGAQSPPKPNSTIASTMSATASETGGSSADTSIPITGFAGQTSATGNAGPAPVSFDLSAGYGLGVVFAGVFAGFAILL